MDERPGWVDRFSWSVVEQIVPSVPAGVSVRDEGRGSLVTVEADPPGWATFDFWILLDQPGEQMELCQTAVWAFLDLVQDVAVRHTTNWWPPAPSGDMVLPEVAIRGNRIEAWFGDEASPVGPVVSVEVEPAD